MLNPIATMLIFTFVFRVILKIDPPAGNPSGIKNFAFFLICALLPWNFLANGLGAATSSVIQNASLIKKVYFPRAVLPTASILSWDTNLLIEFGILSLALLMIGKVVFVYLPVIIVVIFLLTLFVLGVGAAFAALNVYFRDVSHFLQILLLMWFYSTPVLYPIALVPERHVIAGFNVPVRAVYDLNPMVHFTQAFRALFYDLKLPDASTFVYMTAGAGIALLIGFSLFKKLEARFAEEL